MLGFSLRIIIFLKPISIVPGILWGYALRGMVKRLSLDRQLGTVPELLAAQRWQLERALVGAPSKCNATKLVCWFLIRGH